MQYKGIELTSDDVLAISAAYAKRYILDKYYNVLDNEAENIASWVVELQHNMLDYGFFDGYIRKKTKDRLGLTLKE